MRPLMLLVVAGCGRFGFGDAPEIDAAPAIDAPADGPAFVAPGLVVRYAMDDDPSGGVVSSAELPATCATCPKPTTGIHGGAYLFDGAVAFALPSSTLVGAAPYTVALWFRLDEDPLPGYGRSMVNKAFSDAQTTDVFNMLVKGASVPAFETTADGLATSYVIAPAGVNVGEWHHAAAVWDGATKRLYLDGALVASGAATLVDSAVQLQVGADRDMGADAYPWIGALDELQFYARALGDSEISVVSAR